MKANFTTARIIAAYIIIINKLRLLLGRNRPFLPNMDLLFAFFPKKGLLMGTTTTQILFFQHIKGLIPPHVSMVDTLAEILNISNDSAYRRIRGEKSISLEEAGVLADKFKISLDQFLHLKADSFIFSGQLTNPFDHRYENWMEDLLQQVRYMNGFQHKHLYYLAKDVPLLQQFIVPELAIFKSFLWRKSILHYEELKGQKFSLHKYDQYHVELASKIVDVYNQIPSTEIWNVESINSTVRQIEFYKDSGMFETPEDVNELYNAVIRLIDHLEKQAETGLKFCVGKSPAPNAGTYRLFVNELILGDNTAFAELDDVKVTFLNHSVINYIGTHDERFNNHMSGSLQNLIGKSTQLSLVGEKERTQFFNRIRDKTKLVARL